MWADKMRRLYNLNLGIVQMNVPLSAQIIEHVSASQDSSYIVTSSYGIWVYECDRIVTGSLAVCESDRVCIVTSSVAVCDCDRQCIVCMASVNSDIVTSSFGSL